MNCVECDEWRTSTHSDSGSGGNCVAVGNGVKVRDSKDPDGVTLKFNQDTWTKFISEYKSV
jgi:hypothetical protein